MQQKFIFPNSFPTKEETRFLTLVVSSDKDFPALFSAWEKDTVFDKINYATLRLLPLLYMRIRKLGLKSDLNGKLQGIYKLAWVKNQQLLSQVGAVNDLLKEQGIDVLFLKGVALILSSYKDAGARFLDDADILICTADIRKTILLMLGSGWELSAPQFPDFRRLSQESVARIVKECHITNDKKIAIDIHWRLFRNSIKEKNIKDVPFKELIGRSMPVQWNQRDYRMMSTEDMLLHVIVHGVEGNEYRTLRWVTDAVTTMRTHAINWPQFLENVRNAGFQAEIAVAFSYLLENKFISLPEKVLQQIMSLNPSEISLKQFYKKADTTVSSFKVFGGLPSLWTTYWRYESRGIFPMNLYYCLDYFSAAWGLEKTSRLFSFLIGKAKDRIAYLVNR